MYLCMYMYMYMCMCTESYPNGVDFGEVLYAEDAILIGKNHEEVQKVLQKIEDLE